MTATRRAVVTGLASMTAIMATHGRLIAAPVFDHDLALASRDGEIGSTILTFAEDWLNLSPNTPEFPWLDTSDGLPGAWFNPDFETPRGILRSLLSGVHDWYGRQADLTPRGRHFRAEIASLLAALEYPDPLQHYAFKHAPTRMI